MKNKLSSVFSLFIIGLFLLFAMASGGPDGSSNASVAISNCKEMPPVDVQLIVDISLKNKSGEPLNLVYGNLFVVNQAVKQDTCAFEAFPEELEFYTDMSGKYSHHGITITHKNSEDLYRVEVFIPKTALYDEIRTVQVKKYDNAKFIFNLTAVRLSEL